MDKKEFKELDSKFFTKLKFELNKRGADYKILQTDPFSGAIQIGVFYSESPNFFEVYQYLNNGDEASYKFLGHTGG